MSARPTARSFCLSPDIMLRRHAVAAVILIDLHAVTQTSDATRHHRCHARLPSVRHVVCAFFAVVDVDC